MYKIECIDSNGQIETLDKTPCLTQAKKLRQIYLSFFRDRNEKVTIVIKATGY